ncbi:MAG: putative ABC transporter permease [Oscillospiraceae bacterium]|nr:putative ABC transporter permease [Oscillospiraceae bacterium]
MEYTIYQLLWFFFLYSILGWCAGVAAAAVRKHTFVNTGFLNLPLCPTYGAAAVLFAIFLAELRDQLFFLLVGGMVISFLLTVAAGHILERFLHRRWWDYTQYRFQFDGYASFPLLLVWGVLAVLCIKVGNPLILCLLDWIPALAGRILLLIALVWTGLDFALSLAAVLQLRFRTKRLAELSQDLREVSDAFGNAITKRIQRRMMRAYPNLDAEKLVEARAAEEPRSGQVFARGCGFHKLVWLFVIAAFLGDITETIFCRVTAGVWMSRSSVVYGPFSIVWGLGGVMLTALLYKYKDRSDRYLFLAGTVLGGAYEYGCSVFTELVFGTVFWDYSHIPFNLGGRVNLLFCFFWGIAAVIWLKGIYPRLSGLIEKIPRRVGQAGTWLLLAFMLANIVISTLALDRYTTRQTSESAAPETALAAFLDEHFPDERMEFIYPNAVLKG